MILKGGYKKRAVLFSEDIFCEVFFKAAPLDSGIINKDVKTGIMRDF